MDHSQHTQRGRRDTTKTTPSGWVTKNHVAGPLKWCVKGKGETGENQTGLDKQNETQDTRRGIGE